MQSADKVSAWLLMMPAPSNFIASLKEVYWVSGFIYFFNPRQRGGTTLHQTQERLSPLLLSESETSTDKAFEEL